MFEKQLIYSRNIASFGLPVNIGVQKAVWRINYLTQASSWPLGTLSENTGWSRQNLAGSIILHRSNCSLYIG